MAGPLAGVRILDCTTVVLGPWAAQQLGDLGADVVKIEPPEGDTTRQLGPARNPGMAAFYLGCNRSKRSIVLDLKQDAGRNALFKLAETADVLMHNYRPEPAKRLGVEYEAFEKINPRLVYLATYGYRSAGPMGPKAAYDDIIQAGSGLAALQSVVAGQPRFLPTIVADKTSSNGVVSALLAGLFARERTGKGQAIEVPMFETLVSFVMVEHLYGETFRPALETAGYKRVLNKERRPYPSKDGYFALLPYTDGHWKEFCGLVGRPDLAGRCALHLARQSPEERRALLRDAGRDLRHAHQCRMGRAAQDLERAARSGQHARRPVRRSAARGDRLLEGSRSSDRGQAAHARHPAALQQDQARGDAPAAAARRAQRRDPARGGLHRCRDRRDVEIGGHQDGVEFRGQR